MQKLRELFSPEEIISIMQQYGVTEFLQHDNYIIFPTICHNDNEENASMKLYYYTDSCLFFCFTECSHQYDIFSLVKNILNRHGQQVTYKECISLLTKNKKAAKTIIEHRRRAILNAEKKKKIAMQEYDEAILRPLETTNIIPWLEEGIDAESLRKFRIGFSNAQNAIIIPNFNQSGKLIGIRRRTLNEQQEKKKKYMPLYMNEVSYAFPTSYTLYGLYENQNEIRRKGMAFVFEGEKSVLKMDTFFGPSPAVAVYGSKLSIAQMDLLKKFGVKTVFICFDKEYSCFGTKESAKYLKNIHSNCKNFLSFANFYVLMDVFNELDPKDAPIDKGTNIFSKMIVNSINLKEKLTQCMY